MVQLLSLVISIIVVITSSTMNGLASVQFLPMRLTWAVKLDMETVARAHVTLAANTVADDIGLHNLGQIGALFGYYIMIYNASQTVVSNEVPHNLTDLKKESEEDINRLVVILNQKLDQHSFVEWHSHQNILLRSKRSGFSYGYKPHSRLRRFASDPARSSGLHFNDPMFYKQWHLVC